MFRHRFSILVTVVGLCALTPLVLAGDLTSTTPSSGLDVAQALSAGFSHVAETATPAVVFISVESTPTGRGPMELQPQDPRQPDPFEFFHGSPFEKFFKEMPRTPRSAPRSHRTQRGQGSGFLFSSDGMILTNNHVVAHATRIRVRLHDGRKFTAKVIGADAGSDVALIKIDAKDLPHVTLGDSSKLRVGEWVLAIGNPFGLSETVTAGIVSAKGRTHVGLANYENFIQTDAAINPGNSGGPLLNLKGEVIGINAAIYSRSGGSMGIGFAIPVNLVKSVQKQLQHGGQVVRGHLGVLVQDLTPPLAASFGIKSGHGAVVADVTKGSAAAKAGLLAGDVIVGLDGTALKDSGVLRNQIAMRKPGSTVSLDIVRDGTRREMKVVLGTQPGTVTATPAAKELQTEFGITVGPLTSEVAKPRGLSTDHGVMVTAVSPDSAAAFAGIEPGQVILEVNRKPVNDAAAFQKAMAESKKTGRVLLRLQDRDGAHYAVIETK